VSKDDQITYAVLGVTAVVSVVALALPIARPAWGAYWRLRERLLALVMSVYVLGAFVGMGAFIGAAFVYYYDRL
jgi:hypothetical protein